MHNRLIASGCSYTDYCWSTWADILGEEFTEYKQLGMGGADNATIARSIINNAEAGDTVVILWSSYDRFSLYSDEVKSTRVKSGNWQHRGSIVRFDKTFFVNYYHRVERFQTTMDYVQLVDLHSRANNYQAYHFAAFPLFLAETEKTVDPKIEEIYDCYKDKIRNNYLLEPSLEEFMINTNQRILTKHEWLPEGGDTHPIPKVHWEYVDEIISPKLNIKLNSDKKSAIIEETNNIILHGTVRKPPPKQL